MSGTPVLVISGAVGIGKTTTAVAAGRLLRDRNVPHAVVDLPSLSNSWPHPEEDPWNEEVAHENLRCAWENFRRRGAQRLILSRVVEAVSVVTRIEDVVQGDAVLVELRAPIEVIEHRITERDREAAEWFLNAARVLVPRLQALDIADHVITCSDRSSADVAAEVLATAGWL